MNPSSTGRTTSCCLRMARYIGDYHSFKLQRQSRYAAWCNRKVGGEVARGGGARGRVRKRQTCPAVPVELLQQLL